MSHVRPLFWLGFLCLCVSTPLLAATVKKKDGTVVEGEISGVIVQAEQSILGEEGGERH